MEVIQVSAGRGPIECSWIVPKVASKIISEAKKYNIEAKKILSEKDVEKRTFKSILISLSGEGLEKFIETWIGTIKWRAQSPFRPNHKRKNWFVSINRINTVSCEKISLKDVRIDTMRSSGPGGQHANKTESGVRATHLPTGTSVKISSERSQHRNKALAITLLMIKLEN